MQEESLVGNAKGNHSLLHNISKTCLAKSVYRTLGRMHFHVWTEHDIVQHQNTQAAWIFCNWFHVLRHTVRCSRILTVKIYQYFTNHQTVIGLI